jgi:hypothetical protein
MTTIPRPLRLIACLVALSLAAACGSASSAEEFAAKEVETFGADLLPSTLLDLNVKVEEVARTDSVKAPFVDGIGLYSLRDGELLQGTLQVSRFAEAAEPESARFRQSVVAQIGSTVPKAYRMGSETVYLTTGKRQSIAVWFRDRHFFVLSTRDQYDTPRALLRAALEVEP